MTRRDRKAVVELDKGLKAMFGALRARPLPDDLNAVIEQLDDAAPAPATQRERRRA